MALSPIIFDPVGAVPRPLPGLSGLPAETSAERYQRLGDEALARKEWHKARLAFERSLALNPNLAAALIGLAKVAKSEGKDVEVESYFQEALFAHPDDPEVALAWGRYLFLIKRFDEAEKVLRRVLGHRRVRVEAYLNLADVYLLGTNNLAKATESFRAVIDINPDHAGAHYGLGKTLLRMKRFEEGEKALQTAAKLAPRNPLPTYTLGNLYALRAEYDKALTAFAESIRSQPHYLPAYFLRGEIYFNQKRYEQALTEYLAILKIEPGNASAHLRRGFVYERQKRTEDAKRAFLKTIELDPKQAVAYNNLAWIAALQGANLDQALIWSKKSLELSPDVPGFLDTLGWVYRARGELSEAATVLERAVKASKATPADILYHLAVVYQEQGRSRESARYLEKALETESFFEHHEDARKRLEAVTKALLPAVEVASDGQS